MKKLVLIDGNSLINRAYYALPPRNNSKGEAVQAVYGFANMLVKAISDYKPDYMAVAFDLPVPTFRHKMYSEYKAGRHKMPDDLRTQIPMLKEMLKIMGIKTLEKETYEADDIIGTLSKRFPLHTIILTGDRDSLQLIDDTTEVYLTKRGLSEIAAINLSNISERFGLLPEQIAEYKGLAGDSSDNIPGVSGIGEKTAVDLLNKFQTLDGVYAHFDQLTPKTVEKLERDKEKAYLSRELGKIDCAVPIDCEIDECCYSFPFGLDVKRYFIDMSFKSLYKRDELFCDDGLCSNEITSKELERNLIEIKTEEELIGCIKNDAEKLAFAFDSARSVHFTFDGKTEYLTREGESLLDFGLSSERVIKTLGRIFCSSSIVKLLYDAKKTMHALKKHDIKIENYQDVRLMQFLVDQTLDREELADYLEAENKNSAFCACELFERYDDLDEQLDEYGVRDLYKNIELPLEKVLFEMELIGIGVDRDKMNEIGSKLRVLVKQYSEKIYELAGEKFNINSPKQLACVLFEKMQIPYPKKSKKLSTNAEILELLCHDYPIADYILKYRTVSKLVSTYIDGLERLIDDSGRIHTEFKQMLTATGRLSSVEPNLQNIPVRDQEGKELRGMFVADEGKVFVSADYSQIELRLMAHYSQDPVMAEIYNSGGDIHSMTASLVFGVPIENVTQEMRRKAKAVNFGIIYGISEYGLSNNIHCSVKEAKKFINDYFVHFPSIKKYFDDTIESAKKKGEVRTVFGRRRKIPELLSSNFAIRSFGERIAMNTPLQGTAADIIKIAMLKVYEKLVGTESKIILQIHDELIVEAPLSEVDMVKSVLKECMENAVELIVPLTVEVESGKSWIEC